MTDLVSPILRLGRAAILAGTGLLLAGCYVPNGGWTLRAGFDRRTDRKPACFVEMVDTRWDEWNRISQLNAMQAVCEPAGNYGPPSPPPFASPPPVTRTKEPPQLPATPEDLPPSPAERREAAAQPMGGWLFQR